MCLYRIQVGSVHFLGIFASHKNRNMWKRTERLQVINIGDFSLLILSCYNSHGSPLGGFESTQNADVRDSIFKVHQATTIPRYIWSRILTALYCPMDLGSWKTSCFIHEFRLCISVNLSAQCSLTEPVVKTILLSDLVVFYILRAAEGTNCLQVAMLPYGVLQAAGELGSLMVALPEGHSSLCRRLWSDKRHTRLLSLLSCGEFLRRNICSSFEGFWVGSWARANSVELHDLGQRNLCP